MFKKALKFIKKNYHEIIQSIAFYPILISLAFLLLAIVSLHAEKLEMISLIKKNIPYIFIEDYETARSILSTIIGGIISLTVFSFSMVMVVLNQASTNFSPRLLPGLISNKKHQIILGFYIGTLLNCIIILTALGAYGVDSESLGLSTMISALSSLICIGLFVYFINSISLAIQIHNIIEKIYRSTKNYLKKELINQQEHTSVLSPITSEDWTIIKLDRTGYYRDFDISLMNNSIKNTENHIEILPYMNEHVWKGSALLKIKNSVSEEDVKNLLYCFDISSDRHENDRDITGMIKLMEIAVKAMSPGINDPGTAINAVNRLAELICEYLQFAEMSTKIIGEQNFLITEHSICAEELMRMLIQPIRLYSKQDNSVMHVLIKSLLFIQKDDMISNRNKFVIGLELESIKLDIEQSISNVNDKNKLVALLNE